MDQIGSETQGWMGFSHLTALWWSDRDGALGRGCSQAVPGLELSPGAKTISLSASGLSRPSPHPCQRYAGWVSRNSHEILSSAGV